jgi:putative membrane protein
MCHHGSGTRSAHDGDDGLHHHDGWMVALVGVPFGLGYLLLSRTDSGGGPTDDAMTVLRRRYAEGEIDDEEFDSRRRKLQGGN